jgi:hypothetical protein
VLTALILALPLVTQLDVVLTGSGWTSPAAVRRLIATREGALLDESELARDLVRLRTFGILYDVSSRVDGSRVEIAAKDRWSLLPVVGLRHGGGRTTARVGVTDHNAFGQLFTIYGELTSNADLPFVARRLSDRVGNLVYVETPRLFATRLTPFFSWARDFLDFAAFTDAGPGYVYDRARYLLRGELRYELTAFVSIMLGAEGRLDRYRTSDVTHAPGTPPPANDTQSALAGLTLGYVEDFVSQQRGVEVRLTGEVAASGPLSGTLQARGFFIPSVRHNLCLQLLLQATTGQEESFLFRSGGLREIRGFTDAYFAGALMARANAEWRIDVLHDKVMVPFVGQVAVFTDGGWVAGRAGAVAGLDYEGPILSAGAGVRIIPVPIARALGRVDAAFGLVPRRTFDISFSGQQFF